MENKANGCEGEERKLHPQSEQNTKKQSVAYAEQMRKQAPSPKSKISFQRLCPLMVVSRVGFIETSNFSCIVLRLPRTLHRVISGEGLLRMALCNGVTSIVSKLTKNIEIEKMDAKTCKNPCVVPVFERRTIQKVQKHDFFPSFRIARQNSREDEATKSRHESK